MNCWFTDRADSPSLCGLGDLGVRLFLHQYAFVRNESLRDGGGLSGLRCFLQSLRQLTA